ncbi:MAG TPA: hypothetical protein GXX46_06680 [Peptococcaceae bacterium]|nr:hypothetical protein [Peptococcaceae bacterium]
MKLAYLQTDFPNGRSHILIRDLDSTNSELQHYVLVLSNNGKLWVDVFWPYDEEAEQYTYNISEQQFWRTFREWRLKGLVLGDNEKVAEIIARKHLNRKKNQAKI